MSEDHHPEKNTGPNPDPTTNSERTKVKTGAGLHALTAALHSFLDRRLDFYPRLDVPARSVTPDEMIGRFYRAPNGIMQAWAKLKPDDPGLDKAIELAKASLQEVKAQTEYQDQKATRLLTVSTFLTALAGAFYASFSADYPLKTLGEQPTFHWWLLAATYVAFFLFIFFSLSGAMVTFHASRTRFKYPEEATVEHQSGSTRSYLFFREMIGVTPEGWANSFVTVEGEGAEQTATLNPNLKVEYLKNYVSEAYLIAAKTADKLRYLQPAQSLLSYALRCLMLYVLLFVWVITQLAPTKPATTPTDGKSVAEWGPVHVQVLPVPPKPNASASTVAGPSVAKTKIDK
jgi:hypothetical protein